ncbi:MAG: DUF3810 domain-containing protein [Desulfobacterales bacterium]|nr:DUF3810 domain-containing protein [Desulfobacterales bacterium]
MSNIKLRTKQKGIFRYWHLVAIMMAVFIFLFRIVIEGSSEKIEYGYSRFIYPFIADTLSLPGKLVPAPYSASELFAVLTILLAVIWLLYNIYLCIRKKISVIKLFLKTALNGIAVLAGIYFFCMTAWGFNYLRQPFYISLGQESPSVLQQADYEQLAYDAVSLANSLRLKFETRQGKTDSSFKFQVSSFNFINEQTDSAIEKVVLQTSPFRIPSSPPVKYLLSNKFMSACGISGIFLPLFMEPHIDSSLLLWEQPFVTVHEKAHFMGFASETDANLIAYMACLSSESDILRYSAALRVLASIRHYLPWEKWQGIVEKNLSQGVRKDITDQSRRIEQYYRRYASLFQAQQKVNDIYLKLNSQESGISSYNEALPHLVVWWKEFSRDDSNF